jgi:hypothetical protein
VIGYGSEWQPLIEDCMVAAYEAGHKTNFNNNDGDLEGISIAQFNVDNGKRVTSTTAYLDPKSSSKPKNLVIATNVLVSRVII